MGASTTPISAISHPAIPPGVVAIDHSGHHVTYCEAPDEDQVRAFLHSIQLDDFDMTL
jgi:hypothetical protein